MFGDIFAYVYQFIDSFAFLVLAALGMAIIYGMMGITNMAQGELIMIGAYVTDIMVCNLGMPLVVGIIIGTIFTGFVGLVMDRLIVKRLYDRPLDSVVATWGLSIALAQSFVTVLVGGSDPLLGTVLAGGGLGIVQSILNMKFNTFYGKIGILLMAILFIRILPNGFSGYFNEVRLKMKLKKEKAGDFMKKTIRIGVGGPVGSGKTALIEKLCKRLSESYSIGVVTNDIYTKEDQKILTRANALPPERIIGVETGGCPHTAVREDISMNLDAVEELMERFPDLELIFIESGGDNLAATFSPKLVDGLIFVIDVGEEKPYVFTNLFKW